MDTWTCFIDGVESHVYHPLVKVGLDAHNFNWDRTTLKPKINKQFYKTTTQYQFNININEILPEGVASAMLSASSKGV